MEIRIKKDEKAPFDGWIMSDTRYQRYRRAVADKILEEYNK